MTLPIFFSGATERHALIKRAVVADEGSFADDNPHAVIDEDAPAEDGARMDFDSGEKADDLREEAREQFPALHPQPVIDSVGNARVESGIAKQDTERRRCCRITLEDGLDVFPNSREKAHG